VKSYSGSKSKKVKYTYKNLSIKKLGNWQFLESGTLSHPLCFHTEVKKVKKYRGAIVKFAEKNYT